MPRYSPLPSIPIDPRNESELIQAAAQRVYQASGQTLNDFSAGNPLAALIEGQAFAQGEFLFWANQLPDKILLEWIGPFLGAMRRLGTPSIARLIATIPPSNTLVTIPAGSLFSTDPNLTQGESYSFVSVDDVSIPPGETSVVVTVYSQYVGSNYNAPSYSITGTPAVGIAGLTVINPQSATGGSDVETYQQVQERFFTLIRRKNPVSSQDWQDFFVDFYGIGTQTSVKPNRGSEFSYDYLTNYVLPSGEVSFFVLGPNGTELTAEQLSRGQNLVNLSVPIGITGHLYPITLSEIQYDLTVEVEANGAYGSNLKNSSLEFRNSLYSVLQPGNVFPSGIDPAVSDVDSAFYSTIDSTTRYTDPKIISSKAYCTPPSLGAQSALYTQIYSFEPTDSIYTVDDLVLQTFPAETYYPVLSPFTPYSTEKGDQTIYGNLKLKQIQILGAGSYNQSDVVFWEASSGGDDNLHVILENLNIANSADIPFLLSEGKISTAKTYTAWTVGNAYTAFVGGIYNPEIIQYDYKPGQYQPTETIGKLIWVVSQNFTLQQPSNQITGAIGAGLLGTAVTPLDLIGGTSYNSGDWVKTPQIGPGPNAVADPYFNYVDSTRGAITKYAKVLQSFTYSQNELSTKDYFDQLVQQGIIREVIVRTTDGGLPVYKYRPRFSAETYLEYRENSAAAPQYFVATQYFTPNSTLIADLLEQELVVPLVYTESQRNELKAKLLSGTVNTPVRMFRFFAGDTTIFREGSDVHFYTATSNVTPLFDFSVYLANGIFIPSATYPVLTPISSPYIPYFNPDYALYSEDTILSEDGKNLYRVMTAFTPSVTVTDWSNSVVTNTARIQEYAGNLLRYVNVYLCEEEILSQYGTEISATKLGVAQIALIPKNRGRYSNSSQTYTYVWENTASPTETPQLSWYTGTSFIYSPPDYKNGTMKL